MVDVREVARDELVGDVAGGVFDVFGAGQCVLLPEMFVWGEEGEFHVDGLFAGGTVRGRGGLDGLGVLKRVERVDEHVGRCAADVSG